MGKKSKDRLFLVSWDQLGLEGIVDLTERHEEAVASEKLAAWNVLQDKEHRVVEFDTWATHIINVMTMRARFNSHRHYEIFTFKADYDMCAEDFRELFTTAPQEMAELIRAKGQCILNNRASAGDSIKIT